MIQTITEQKNNATLVDYAKSFEIDSEQALLIADEIEAEHDREEFTFEDLARETLEYALYLQCVLVRESACHENELDNHAVSLLEKAIENLQSASSEIFFADDYNRRYSFVQFAEHVENYYRTLKERKALKQSEIDEQ